MPHLIALIGGAEFLPGMEEVDRYLIERASEPSAHVLVMPTAAARERPDRAAANGVRHFEGLGARAEALMVVDKASANDESMARKVREANLVYFAGGSPAHLLETMRGSLVWQAILECHQQGAILAGSSAGAMALCGSVRVGRDPIQWKPGLGLVPGAVVLPHFERMSPEAIAQTAKSLPEGVVCLGIDEQTAAIGDGESWLALGKGGITLWSPSGSRRYIKGESFSLGEH